MMWDFGAVDSAFPSLCFLFVFLAMEEMKSLIDFDSISKSPRLGGTDHVLTIWFRLLVEVSDRCMSSLLWTLVVIVLAAAMFFSLSCKCAFYLTTAMILISFLAHQLHEVASGLREYPYWRSVEQRRIDQDQISLPIILSGGIIAVGLGCKNGSNVAASLLLYMLALEAFIRTVSKSLGSSFLTLFRECLVDNLRSDIAVHLADSSICLHDDRNSEVPCVILEKNNATNSSETEFSECLEDEQSDADEVVVSRQTRVRTASGEIRVYGMNSVEFEQDQELVLIFISFCPPFAKTPTFDFEQITDDEITVKTSSVQPFGVRLEARRRLSDKERECDNRCSFDLDYFASDASEQY